MEYNARFFGTICAMEFTLEGVERFIVRAKQHTYIGNGPKLLPYRLGSSDLQFGEGDWTYHDSYFGESDFIGQEIVYWRKNPVWGMNYFGVILQYEKITAVAVGRMLRESLSLMYGEGRFLGGFEHLSGALTYMDHNEGNVQRLRGREQILLAGEVVYELVYHGGLLRF